MTEEEAREYNRLVNEYNRLVAENNRMIEEINYAQESMVVLANNMATVSANVVPNVKYVSEQVNVADTDVSTLMRALEDLTRQYFIFKELSTASKNLTQYNDEYFTKFQFFNELRRITLGYVIGLDSYIISNESLRKKVEKCYLANTDYWLAYAIMSVMLWASNEKSAAYRALHKALKMDSKKSSVFYMLVNLRFGRIDPAAKWYLYYLDRTDVNDLGDEWQKLLQAYLSGALGADPKLEKAAEEYYQKIFEQTQALNAGYDLRVQARSEEFAGPDSDPGGHILRRHAGRIRHSGIGLHLAGDRQICSQRHQADGFSCDTGVCRMDGGAFPRGQQRGGAYLQPYRPHAEKTPGRGIEKWKKNSEPKRSDLLC